MMKRDSVSGFFAALRRAASFALAAALLAAGLAGCGESAARGSAGDSAAQAPEQASEQGAGRAAQNSAPLRIVTTIFPEYDWVREVLGENPAGAELKLLLDSGVDLHSFQPTAEDILDIASCDLFVYVGGESDKWVEDALRNAENPDRNVICLLEALGDRAREEELVEGMESEEEEDGEGGDGEPEYDEHVWLSLRNAEILVDTLAEAICALDAEHAEDYRRNAADYGERLRALDEEYRAAVLEGSFRVLLFGDRFPFRYLVDDYGLSYYAAFTGCSAETEASFETVAFLARKVDELSLRTVLTIENSDGRIAETIVQNTGTKDQRILAMDSMQSVTARDASAGADYLSIMEANLGVLREALKE